MDDGDEETLSATLACAIGRISPKTLHRINHAHKINVRHCPRSVVLHTRARGFGGKDTP
jgi:hypothetical protein